MSQNCRILYLIYKSQASTLFALNPRKRHAWWYAVGRKLFWCCAPKRRRSTPLIVISTISFLAPRATPLIVISTISFLAPRANKNTAHLFGVLYFWLGRSDSNTRMTESEPTNHTTKPLYFKGFQRLFPKRSPKNQDCYCCLKTPPCRRCFGLIYQQNISSYS